MAQKDLMHLARNPKTAKTICTCFRQYDSWGIELDCIKVFSGNWEAISQKLLVILCVNVIATVQVPLTGSHSPSSCSLHSFCQVIRQCGQDIEVGQDLEAAWPAKLGHCCQLCSQDFGQ